VKPNQQGVIRVLNVFSVKWCKLTTKDSKGICNNCKDFETIEYVKILYSNEEKEYRIVKNGWSCWRCFNFMSLKAECEFNAATRQKTPLKELGVTANAL